MIDFNIIWMQIKRTWCELFGHDFKGSESEELACVCCGKSLGDQRAGK